MTDTLTVAVAQIAPVWLDRDRTITKVEAWAERAAAEGAGLVAFGEALVPGYPWWLEHTDAARFDDMRQKEWFAHYTDQSCEPDRHFKDLAGLSRDLRNAVVSHVVAGADEAVGGLTSASDWAPACAGAGHQRILLRPTCTSPSRSPVRTARPFLGFSRMSPGRWPPQQCFTP